MRYISTRGAASPVGFEQALLEGLAPDGGLYVPQTWPSFSRDEIAQFSGADFSEVAATVIAKFAPGRFDLDQLRALAAASYATFNHAQTVPLRQFGDEDWLMELYHGPTLAFKDVAMQFLGQLFNDVLNEQDKRVTIIGATSGDTGAAAIEAFRGQDRVDVFILHPEGRVSEVQRKIMTTVDDENIFNIAVDGTFDDCQSMVKALFGDRSFANQFSLSGVNSINWVRLAVQIVYYFTTSVALGGPDKKFSFVAPTGNFGDIFAGYAAKNMGLPIDKLCIAVNDNDILHRALTTGVYRPLGVKKTISPSMDIQVASNFERLVFEASDRDADIVKQFVGAVDGASGATLPADIVSRITEDFISERVDEKETADTIKAFWQSDEFLIDPHTAIGVAAMQKAREKGALSGDVVCLSTAHPAKFPEAVEGACGQLPKLPSHFADLYEKPEKCLTAGNNIDEIKAVMRKHSRISG